MNMKRTIAALLLVCMCIVALPLRAEAAGYYSEDDLENIRCTLISNPHRADYVNRVMAWHILSSTNNYRVGRNLKNGKSVVFLFDGCSDKVDDPVYGDTDTYHISTYCAVVQEVNGVLRIVYESDNCATIPDHPRNPELNNGNNVPTLLDGVYNIYSKNHQGRYSALRVEDYSGTAPVIRCNATGSYVSTAVGINIHARSEFPDVVPNTIAEGTYSSTGCLNVGLVDDGWKEYDEFIYQVMGVTDAVTTSTFDIGTRCREWVDMGVVIVDRSHYKEQLKEIYGDDNSRSADELVGIITAYTDELGFAPSECTYASAVTEATCTEGGYTTYTCTVCGDSYVDDETEPLGHMDASAVVTEPSCTEGGYTTHTCGRCGETHTDSETEPLGHDYADGVCSRCGDEEGLLRGDANGDGSVDSDDAIHLLFHVLFGAERYPVSQSGDFNGDGEVDSDDAIHLLFHVLFGGEDYPLT